MDASTPKGDALVGVRQQALAAGNNALYDITNASMVLYRRVCEDIVKCLQVIPPDSVLYRVYQKSIGEKSMDILHSFDDLPMYNFGVMVIQEMSDEDRMFLEQNVQATLAQKEIDLEDAMAIRQVKDIDQAQRLRCCKEKEAYPNASASAAAEHAGSGSSQRAGFSDRSAGRDAEDADGSSG